MKFNTINPATNQIIQEYETISKEKALEAAKQSHEAFEEWKKLSVEQRKSYFSKLAQVLRENKEEWGKLMSIEMGKPIKEAIPEVEKCAYLADVLVEKAEQWLKDEKLEADGKEHIVRFDPLGPIFIIMPWNFPFWQAFKVALAPLIAGNTIVMKHARNVTGCSLAIQDAFIKAGFPNGVFESVIIDHESSAALIESNYIAACSLTGSVGAGSKIASQAGKVIKPLVLELGGSDPHIVLEDADIEKAAQGAVKGRTLNAGQVCIGSKRIIVHKAIANQFSERFATLIKELKVGDPLDPTTDIGPLVNEQAVKDMLAFVDDAVLKGATLLAGGKRLEGEGFFFEPAVLANTTSDMSAVCNETFGPVAPIIVVEDEQEAIKIANESEFGLSSSIWTKDLEKAKKIAAQINAGAVFINSISKSHPLLPIGGIKKSGYGRELSQFGIREFCNIKAINLYEA